MFLINSNLNFRPVRENDGLVGDVHDGLFRRNLIAKTTFVSQEGIF